MAKRKSRRGAKTKAVRSYMEQHPQASAAEIVSALNDQGIKVSTAIIYNLRSVATKKTRRKRVAAASANGASKRVGRPRRVGSVSLSEEQLLATKQLADQLGGTDALRRTLDLLEKLRNERRLRRVSSATKEKSESKPVSQENQYVFSSRII